MKDSDPIIKACVFDAYGTLFDVHAAVREHRNALGDDAERVSALWRAKQLEYTWLRSLMGRHADFYRITQDALDYALDAFGVADPALREDLMGAYLRLPCFPDAPDVLLQLREAGLQTAILSNGSPEMLEAAARSSRLMGLLDAILSIEAVGVYKPDPRVYRLPVKKFGLATSEMAFVSANAWDAAGASALGYWVAWINRTGQPRERLPFQPDAEIETLSALPALLGL